MAGTGVGGFSAGSGGASAGTGGNSADGGLTGSGGTGAGGSTGAAGAAGTGGATGGGGSGCVVTIIPVAPPSVDNVEAGPGARMRVAGSVRGAFAPPVVWQWTVMSESSATPIPTTTIDSVGSVVEFPVETAGVRYQIVAELAGQPNCRAIAVVSTVAPGPMVYVFRVTASGLPVQETRVTLADPQPPATLALQSGIAADILPLRADQNGESLASYVRISNPGSALSIDADSANGAVMAPLLPSLMYDVLIVPLEAYAPSLLSGTPGSFPRPLQLDRGVPVNATLRDGGGQGVVGARLVLRRGAVPSTVGVSDGTGAASLWARPGTLAAYVVPPIGSGLPNAAVGAGGDPGTDPGILLDPGVASLDLAMTWDRVTSASLSIHVLAPGGGATGAGARVRATSQGALGPVGTLIAHPAGGSPVTLRATGSTDVELVTDASGTAVFSALPMGSYNITIIPASVAGAPAAGTLAITSTTVTLAAGGLTRNVTLSTKSTLNGTLLPLPDSPGAQVTAIDRSVTAPGTVVSAIVAADGTYQLFVDPGRSYELLAQPRAGALVGRMVLASSVSDATPTIGTVTLPAVHPVHGTVTVSAGGTVGGALVQVFCPSTSTKCLDATFSLAEALTRADGSYDLALPDPPSN